MGSFAADNAWLSVPLSDYEGHMGSQGTDQLSALADLFTVALSHCRPESVAVLGIAGGNGLDRIDSALTRRVIGVDINPAYLTAAESRYAHTIAGLELHCCNLSAPGERPLPIAPVALVHAALFFEHAGWDVALDHALALVAPGGTLAVVLQLPSAEQDAVAPTGYASIQRLKRDFALVDREAFCRKLQARGFGLQAQDQRAVPGGKALWLGLLTRA